MSSRLVLVARTLYGARNAFALIASALSKHGLLGSGVRLLFVDEEPLRVVGELVERGRRVAVLYGLSTPLFMEFAREVAAVAERVPVIVGGPHGEGAFWQVLRIGAYAVVVGDGENAIVGLVESLLGERDIGDVPNIAYASDGVFRVTRIEHVELDEYEPFSSTYGLYPPIEIMRGCPYRCRFCQVPWLFKARVRYRSLHAVLDAVKAYVKAGRRRVRFTAPIGFAYLSRGEGKPNPQAVEELLAGTRRLGGIPFLGSFPSETRPEYVTGEVLAAVKRYAGNRRVSVGLQSGSERVLKAAGRDHSVEDAVNALMLVKSFGLQPVADIIFGLPGEGEEDVEATVRLAERLAGQGVRLRFHSFLPLPGTPFARYRPRPVHRSYRRLALRLLGKGLAEGDWELQEELAYNMYCLTMLDPAPTPQPQPVRGEEPFCRRVWRRYAGLLGAPLEAGEA